jgi:wyosine [tRNA(Phe)-imidazoG37] synthetase (radical SAM superfamily)
MVLQLKQGILYGPVNSRRYGKSLGVNLMPGSYKLCSFNCQYCHFGWTDKRAVDLSESEADLPTPDAVAAEVERAAKSSLEFRLITFSGNGESTLHPQFPEIVDRVVAIRDRRRPDAKVALLSNSTGLARPEVRECIAKLDLPVLKLDAGTAKTFKAINRPAPEVDYDTIVEQLCSLDNIYIQTVLVGGTPSNTSLEDLDAYFVKIKQIKPLEVHMYSIDRPVPNTKITLVPPKRLREIAAEGEAETGVRIRAFCKN